MHKLRITLASLAAVALSAGLAAGTIATDARSDDELVGVYPIEGLTWLLTGQVIDGEMVAVPERLGASLRMDGGDAGGNGGCNSYFTSYELDGFELTFGPIGSTMMACVPPIMDTEQAFLANLAPGRRLPVRRHPDGAARCRGRVPAGVRPGARGHDRRLVGRPGPQQRQRCRRDERLHVVDHGCLQRGRAGQRQAQRLPRLRSTAMPSPSRRSGERRDGLSTRPSPSCRSSSTSRPWAPLALTVDTSDYLELRDADGALQVNYLPAE